MSPDAPQAATVVEPGIIAAFTHDRTVDRSAIVQTRQVTVMTIICGVDVCQAWLDAWIERAGHRRFANAPEGVAELVAFCRDHDAELVVMEASGGVEQDAFLALWQQGQPCAIANPRSVRKFAEAMGYLEKTDRIDAEMICGYALAKRTVATPPPSADQQRLTALATRLRQVTQDLGVQKQRVHSTREATALESLKETIAFFTAQAKRLAAEMVTLIDADPLWTALDRSFRSIKGVADRTVAYMLAELPEIGSISNRAITKLVGLAPLADDSGKRHGRRSIRGGRAGIRSILFLVADVARKYDPTLNAFRERLLAKGLSKMQMRVALARKLLVRLNAKARDARAELEHAL
jgi:transposase